MKHRAGRTAATAAALVALAAGCGGDARDRDRRLVVSAASSLTEALTRCSGPEVRLSFAGSDELAAQIRRGVRPDVFAAADTTLPAQLARERRVERPVTFATNELVLAVPRGSTIDAVEDLSVAGLRIAIGAAGVPVGAYARAVLDRMGEASERAILGNVRSEEPDVKGVLGKVGQRAVDAGFVYASDVVAADGRVRAVRLPRALRPMVGYGAAVVRGAANPAGARRYVEGLVRGACARALRRAGFGPPPGGAPSP